MSTSSLNECPKCKGPADNGHDRCLPPNPYYCTKCMAEEQRGVYSETIQPIITRFLTGELQAGGVDKDLPGEISLVKRLRIVSNMIHMGEKISWGEETTLMDQAANEIERLTKPVSVSLEKCARIIRAGSCIIGNDYCERLCESNPCACAINYSKAVLDAAGVKYVD